MDTILLDQCGCWVTVPDELDPLTLILKQAYEAANNPLPTQVLAAFDYIFLELKNHPAAITTDVVRFTIEEDPDNPGVPIMVYSVPELENATAILSVTMEGQEINESDPLQINIDADAALVTFGVGLTIGASVKIMYRKLA